MIDSTMTSHTNVHGNTFHKNMSRAKSRNMLGQGQFSIYLPRRVDAEYYIRSPIKVKVEMLLSPEHLSGRSIGSIPCRAWAEKLTSENGMSIVNVPIKIKADLLLTPGMAFSCKPATPQSPTPQDIHEGSLAETKQLQMAKSWELWGKKMRAALSKYRSQFGVKSENLWQTKQVLVSELPLNDNATKTKELIKRISTCAAQVFEQNKRIHLLQARLRKEERSQAESSKKVNVVEKQCKLLEKRLKAAESKALGAEYQAEAIKLRIRDLGVVCGHQGVQLKELAKQVDFFAKILSTQKIAALDTYRALEQQVGMQMVVENEPLSAGGASTYECSGSSLKRTNNNKPFKIHCPLVEFDSQTLPCQKSIISKQENQLLSLPCNSNTIRNTSLRNQILMLTSRSRSNLKCFKLEQEIPCNRLGFFSNQLMHFAPNQNMNFNSSMKQAEELIQSCVIQASKLKDLSVELDCLGTKAGREQKSSPIVLLFEQPPYKIRSDSVESSPFHEGWSSKTFVPPKVMQRLGELAVATDILQISVKDVNCSSVLASKQTRSFVDRPIFHKFMIILDSISEKELKDQSTQTLLINFSLGPTLEIWKENEFTRGFRKLSLSSSQSYAQVNRQAALRKASLPLQYELQMWRLVGRILIEASLLCFGIHLLPHMQLFRFIPPAT